MLDDSQGLAQKIIKRQQTLFSNRATWETHWRDINDRVTPSPNYFTGNIPTPGEKRTRKIFDSTAPLALDRFASAMESVLTPRTQRWHTLTPRQKDLKDNAEVKRYCDDLTDLLFAARYNASANFASQMFECYKSLGAFGTTGLFVDEFLGGHKRGLRYKSIHLSELFIAENSYGVVDTVYRKFKYTAAQAVHAFGKENVPHKILDAANNSPYQSFEFIHAVYDNEDYDPNKKDPRAMRFKSCYVSVENAALVRESGYRTMPYCVGRYMTSSNEEYGGSPVMSVLASIMTLNEMMKTTLRGGHLAVNPPLLLKEDGALMGFSGQPGQLNRGGLDSNGQPQVVPLKTDYNFQAAEYLIRDQRETINNGLLISLFQILVENKTMTATEAMYRQQEKGALLAPSMGRQQSEMLSPMIERELDILSQMGLLPQMPEILMQYGGDLVDIEYTSPLNKAQRAEEGVAILNSIQTITGLSQIDPSVLKVFDFRKAIKELAEIYGVPDKLINSDEDIAAMDQQQAMQQQAQQALQAAPVLAQTSKVLAESQNIASQAGAAIIR